MSFLQAIIMGVLQGVLEFLPFSSSGHFTIAYLLFGFQSQGTRVYDACIHIGTLMAVSVIFQKDIRKIVGESGCILYFGVEKIIRILKNLIFKENHQVKKVINSSYRKLVVMILLTSISTGVIGFVSSDLVKLAGELLLFPGILMMLSAFFLILSDFLPEGTKLPKNISYTNSFIVGIFQGISVLPGLSKTGIMIFSGLASKFDRKFAAKYTFLASIPCLAGRLLFDIFSITSDKIETIEIIYGIIGGSFSFIIGIITIKIFLSFVKQKRLKFLGFYCFIVGIIAVAGFFLQN